MLCDPMAVVVDWLDAYRAADNNQIVEMYSLDCDRVRLRRSQHHPGSARYRGLLAPAIH